MTQQQLAAEALVSLSSVSRVERALPVDDYILASVASPFPPQLLTAIADVLGRDRVSPWSEIAADGLRIVEVPMSPDAAYFPEFATIVVRPGLPHAIERSVLTEELAHHRLGHVPQSDPVEWARQELRAQRKAAVALIPLEVLAEAIAASDCWHDVAEHLDVDPFYLERRVRDLTPDEDRTLRRTLGRLELDL